MFKEIPPLSANSLPSHWISTQPECPLPLQCKIKKAIQSRGQLDPVILHFILLLPITIFFAKVAWSWDLIFYSVLSFFTRLTHLLFCTISGLHVDTLTDLNFTQVYVWMKNCSLRSEGQTVAVLTGALKILLNSGKPTGLGITSSAVISSAGCTQQQSSLPFQLPWLPFGPPILTFKMQAGEPVEGGGDIAGGRLASGQFFRRSPAHWRGLCWKYNFSQCSFSQCYCISSMFA